MKRLAIAAATLGLTLGFGGFATAHAEESCTGSPLPEACTPSTTVPAEVQGEVFEPAVVANVVTSQPVASQASPTLPVTGGDVLGLAVIGAGAVAAGSALMVVRRRRSVEDNA